MKATIKVTDKLEKKSIELSVNFYPTADAATQLNNAVRKKANRERIIKDLKLYFGEAALELTCEGKVYATGIMSFNAFSGRGNVETRNAA